MQNTSSIQLDIAKLAVDENSWHNVLEYGEDVIPLLDARFDISSVSEKTAIIRIIVYLKSQKGLGLVRKALENIEEAVWKAGLDAAVSLGGSDASNVVRKAALERSSDKKFTDWSNEALRDIDNEMVKIM